ncbi:MAG: carbon starvation protein A [FCB group bacterium]|nr:carbon starvation protein A [FCB group bacterium]
MNSLLLAVIVFAGYLIAYHTYGRFLAKKIFNIDPDAPCPSETLRDNVDFVPTNKHVLFGHHYTSIAGLGPIVGPAVAIIWGWVPAMLWVFFGSIFMGAVHDFGSLIVSLRGKGRSIGDLSNGIVNSRVRTLFLLIIFFELWIVIAIFALIIALLFNMYPESVLPVWLQLPIAVALGYFVYEKGRDHVLLGIVAVILMYVTVVAGAYLPFTMPAVLGIPSLAVWIIILLVYAYIASTIPVQKLLQPRDYMNSHQLFVAMLLLALGVLIAHPQIIAPKFVASPEGAPPILPFLFVIIACGAISGFHCLVASGTSSKQCDREGSAQFISYGGMLMEGVLSTFVLISIGAGLGLGLKVASGETLTGVQAFTHHYANWAAASGLSAKLGAFVTGSSNLISALGIPEKITIAIMGVFLVSFAGTTLDSATRIQRYVVSELAGAWRLKFLTGKHPATLVAVLTAFLLAFSNGSGKGALLLWPLFGAVNQLLAGLALLVITVYLARRHTRIVFTAIPMVFMIIMTGWAMIYNLNTFFNSADWFLFAIGLATLLLEVWMVVESIVVLKKVYRG